MPDIQLEYLVEGDPYSGQNTIGARITSARRQLALELAPAVAEAVCRILGEELGIAMPWQMYAEVAVKQVEGGVNIPFLRLKVEDDLGLADRGAMIRNLISNELLDLVNGYPASRVAPDRTVGPSFQLVWTDRGRIWGHERTVADGSVRSWGDEREGQEKRGLASVLPKEPTAAPRQQPISPSRGRHSGRSHAQLPAEVSRAQSQMQPGARRDAPAARPC